jgi:uncharacterized repeat protein (TIGR01451 family)
MENKFFSSFYRKASYLSWVMFLFGVPQIKVQGQVMNASCNQKSAWINGNYTNLAASGSATGICLGSATGTANLIDKDLTNFASLSLTGLGCTGTIIVKDNDVADTYPAGTFAGFEVSTTGLLSENIASTVTIRTYNDGILGETHNAVTSLTGVNSSLLNANGNAVLGFITTQPFDEIRIAYQPLVSALFSAQVYGAIIEKFCVGTASSCSANNYLVNSTYPVIIDETLTGANVVSCSVSNAENVVDNINSNYANIVLTAGVVSSGSLAVKDVLTSYPIGTFAGFDIDNSALIGSGLLNGASVSTYLNGVFQESSGGSLISLNLLSASRQIVGFKTTKTFDEVRFTASNVLGSDLGVTKVYGAVLKAVSATGNTAPVISTTFTAVKNSCPLLTVNLNNLVTSSTPVGATLVWFTNNVHAGETYASSTAATAGVYYAFYYDAIKDCYSPATSPLTVTITVCANPDNVAVNAGSSSTILILANDKNADGTVITNLTKITTPTIIINPTKGTATVNSDGSINYTPNAGIIGMDTFVYSIYDKANTTVYDTAKVFVTINKGTANLKISKILNGNTKIFAKNSPITYTIVIENLGTTDATNIVVKDSSDAGLKYLSNTISTGTFSTPLWNIPLLAAGATATLTISAKVINEGISFNFTKIQSLDQNEITPDDNEDRDCVSVPFKLCSGDSLRVSVPIQFTDVVWFNNGVSVGTKNTLIISRLGSYTFKASNAQCPAQGCCPIVVEDGKCCRPDI